jgi:hypothetical protein
MFREKYMHNKWPGINDYLECEEIIANQLANETTN